MSPRPVVNDLAKWFSSGRGIFKRDAGFQVATMPIVPNWQEDTAMVVGLLNDGERLRVAPQRFVCVDCGFGVRADEDGCCAMCGRGCAVVAVLENFPDVDDSSHPARGDEP